MSVTRCGIGPKPGERDTTHSVNREDLPWRMLFRGHEVRPLINETTGGRKTICGRDKTAGLRSVGSRRDLCWRLERLTNRP